MRILQWLGDALVTSLVLALGVVLVVSVARSFELTWEALGRMFGALRDLGILFLGIDKGWSPGDVFEDLRERGLVNGEFEEIVWSGPGRSEWRKR